MLPDYSDYYESDDGSIEFRVDHKDGFEDVVWIQIGNAAIRAKPSQMSAIIDLAYAVNTKEGW